MIGRTNASNKISSDLEIVNISLLSNQISHQDLMGTIITFSYDDYSEEILWKGTLIIRNIPANIEYTITFGEVNGYKTPSSVTYTSVKGFSRSVEATYYSEFLTLNVTGTDTPIVTIKKVKKVGVSEKYKVVDYIETNGTQYIDTGFQPNQNTRVVVDFKADNVAQHVWGSRIEWRNNSFLCCWETNFDWCVQINAANFNGGSFDAKARHTVEMSCTEFKVDGTTTATYSVDAFQCTNNLLIASVQSSEQNENFVGKYYSFKIYDGNNLIRDYIPVKNSQGVYGLYDKINDTFSSSTGSLAGGGYTYDETIATQTSVSGLHKIVYDTEYVVEASAVKGFTTPEVQCYTANQPSRNISVDYLIAEERVIVNISAEDGASVDGNTASVHTSINGLGIYIQDINGRLWSESEWNNSTTPNGIAVVTHECQFVIALEDAGDGEWLEDLVLLDGLPSLDGASAKQDYNGISNTNVLLASELSSSAAINCNNYTFPDGSKGYLGAAGEWQAVIDNEAKITSALNLCGGKSFTKVGGGVYYWTSTQYNIRGGYIAGSEYLGSTLVRLITSDKTSDTAVRAFKSIGSIEKHTITNGKASFNVTYDETYTVSLSDMDGYDIPASQTYTASQPTREISMEYTKSVEHVIVRVIYENYAFANGQVLTVSGGVTGSYTINNNTVEFDVPEGLTYTISVNDKDGYITPGNQTFTAGTGTRQIDMVYEELRLGVFIQGVSGKLYETDSWQAQEASNGVAVITENCRFVMALEDDYDFCQWGSYGTTVSNITTTTSKSTAKTDYDGEAQTITILDTLGNSSSNNDAPAAYYCRAYTFPNGKKGYLGAAGEWQAVADNKAAIESALSKCGGAEIGDYYWTSTQYNSYKSWDINFENDYSNGYLEHYDKNDSNYVRAFCSL